MTTTTAPTAPRPRIPGVRLALAGVLVASGIVGAAGIAALVHSTDTPAPSDTVGVESVVDDSGTTSTVAVEVQPAPTNEIVGSTVDPAVTAPTAPTSPPPALVAPEATVAPSEAPTASPAPTEAPTTTTTTPIRQAPGFDAPQSPATPAAPVVEQ